MANADATSQNSGLAASDIAALQALKQALNNGTPLLRYTEPKADQPLMHVNGSIKDDAFLTALSSSIFTIQTSVLRAPPTGGILDIISQNNPNAQKDIALLAAVKPTGEMDSATLQALQMLKARTEAYENPAGGNPELKRLQGLGQIVTSFQNLSPQAQSQLETARAFMDEPSKGDTGLLRFQAAHTVDLARSYLHTQKQAGLSDTAIDSALSTGLKDYLKGLKEQNPDAPFVAQKYDKRAVDYLNQLVQQRMAQEGLNQNTLNDRLMRIWSMQSNPQAYGGAQPSASDRSLGELVAMRNLLQYSVSGQLHSGGQTAPSYAPRPWTKGWNDNNAPDRFFSQFTYNELASRSGVVRAETLFVNADRVPQQALIKQIAEHLHGKDGFDKNAKTFTREQVGMIAAEIMAHQAKLLCIPEKDINNAIHSGKYMPHLDDLLLVEKGMGIPKNLPDIVTRHQTDNDVAYSFKREVDAHRNEKFTSRFGQLDQKYIDEILNGKYYQEVQTLGRERAEAWVRKSQQLPINYYGGMPFGEGGRYEDDHPVTKYMRRRNDEYMAVLAEADYEKKIGACLTGGGYGTQGPVPSTPTQPSQQPQTGPQVPASPNGGSDNTCTADTIGAQGCKTEHPPKPTTTTGCYADTLNTGLCNVPPQQTPPPPAATECTADTIGNDNGCRNAFTRTSAAGSERPITGNASDVTGQTSSNPPAIYADQIAAPSQVWVRGSK